jgi:ABC-type glycerol-3-phosphate transport system permease component
VSRLGRLVPHLVVGATALAVLYPLWFMVTAALKTDDEYTGNKLGVPSDATFDNVSDVLQDPNLLTWVANSAIITSAAVALAIVCALPAAFGISRSPGASRLLLAMIALLAIPPVILVIPLFKLFADAGMLNTRTGAVVVYAGLITPLAIYLFHSFFRTVPPELDDAAYIDGATRFQILRHVFVPLARPAIVTVAIVGGAYVWNEFLIALLFLQEESAQTLIVGLTSFQGRYDTDEPLLMAWSLAASLPMIAVYLFGQRYLVRGLTGGALK